MSIKEILEEVNELSSQAALANLRLDVEHVEGSMYAGRLGRLCVARREKGLTCPNCGEVMQIQVIQYLQSPTKWKCRKGHCRHVWEDDLGVE